MERTKHESRLTHAEAILALPSIVDDEIVARREVMARRMAEAREEFWRWVETRRGQ